MKLEDLFEGRFDNNDNAHGHAFNWHQGLSFEGQRNWVVKDLKGRIVFDNMTQEEAEKVLTNPNLVRKYGRLFTDIKD